MILSLVAAMAKGRIIGKDNQMPWHLPADLKHFKETTLGKPVLMGRKTFASIGRPLPGRRNLVVSRQPGLTIDGVDTYSSVDDALASCQDVEEVMVIGGGQIYQQLLPRAQRLYLTFIDAELDGDTRFPDWLAQGQWQELACSQHPADARNAHDLSFVTLQRVPAED